ncbi:MAG: hypothetical protein AAGJ82_04415 [Bacteroidota bacterium]
MPRPSKFSLAEFEICETICKGLPQYLKVFDGLVYAIGLRCANSCLGQKAEAKEVAA